jgi:hypothetical protein
MKVHVIEKGKEKPEVSKNVKLVGNPLRDKFNMVF